MLFFFTRLKIKKQHYLQGWQQQGRLSLVMKLTFRLLKRWAPDTRHGSYWPGGRAAIFTAQSFSKRRKISMVIWSEICLSQEAIHSLKLMHKIHSCWCLIPKNFFFSWIWAFFKSLIFGWQQELNNLNECLLLQEIFLKFGNFSHLFFSQT